MRISAEIPDEDFRLLQRLAVRAGVSMTNMVRRALHTEKWVNDALASGLLLVEDGDGRIFKVRRGDEGRD